MRAGQLHRAAAAAAVGGAAAGAQGPPPPRAGRRGTPGHHGPGGTGKGLVLEDEDNLTSCYPQFLLYSVFESFEYNAA